MIYISPGTLWREGVGAASENVISVRVEGLNEVVAVLFVLPFLYALHHLFFRRGPCRIFH